MRLNNYDHAHHSGRAFLGLSASVVFAHLRTDVNQRRAHAYICIVLNTYAHEYMLLNILMSMINATR